MKALDLIRRLRANGIDANAILDAVEGMEEERLAKDRAKTAKYRNNKKNRHVTTVTPVTLVTRARVEGSSSSTESTGKKDNRGTANAALVTELETVLDPEHAAAVVEHRQKIRHPMTVRAAKALAGKFAQCPNPNAAADTMLARGWRGIEPEWLSADGKTKPEGEVIYKFTTVEEVMAEVERERKAANGG